jgi:hypothetical protein
LRVDFSDLKIYCHDILTKIVEISHRDGKIDQWKGKKSPVTDANAQCTSTCTCTQRFIV